MAELQDGCSPVRKRARWDAKSGDSSADQPLGHTEQMAFPLGLGEMSPTQAPPKSMPAPCTAEEGEPDEGGSSLGSEDSDLLGEAIEGAVKGIMRNRFAGVRNRSDGSLSDSGSASEEADDQANIKMKPYSIEPDSDAFVIHCCATSDSTQRPLVADLELEICSDDSGVQMISPCAKTQEIVSNNTVKSIHIRRAAGNKTVIKISFSPVNHHHVDQLSNFSDISKLGRQRKNKMAYSNLEGTTNVTGNGKFDVTVKSEENILVNKNFLKNLGQIVSGDIFPKHESAGKVKDEIQSSAEDSVEGFLKSDSEDHHLGSSTSLDSNSLPLFSGDPLIDPLGMGLFTSSPNLTSSFLGLQGSMPSTPTAAEMNITITDDQCIYENGARRWKCKECEKSYTTKHNLINHMMGHRGLKPHRCQVCGKFFKQVSHLSTHLLTHSQTRPHKCDICQRTFTQTSHMKRHMTIHMERRPHICSICNRGFAFPGELKAHMEKHDNPVDSACEECGVSFDSPRKLKHHKATVHGSEMDLTCDQCGKMFTYPSQLRDHMVKHSGFRPFMCTECGMEFMKEHHLKAHLFTHTGLKPWVCPVCGRAFNQKANMQRHMLIHGTQKLFKCEVCEKEFSQPQTLKAHMITHAETKPFQCSTCGKEFGRLHNLQGHMHIHQDTKPHPCFCGASFTLKGNLTRHRKVKHGLDDSSECTDEEAAIILNSMSGRCLVGEVDNLFMDENGATPTKKSRKSVPRKIFKEDGNSEDELEGDWEELERLSSNGEEEAEEVEEEEEGEGEGEEAEEEETEKN